MKFFDTEIGSVDKARKNLRTEFYQALDWIAHYYTLVNEW